MAGKEECNWLINGLKVSSWDCGEALIIEEAEALGSEQSAEPAQLETIIEE